MKRILLSLLMVSALVSCDKDEFETKPKLTVESLSSNFIPRSAGISIILGYTDKEGDVSDSLFVMRKRINTLGARYQDNPPFPYKIPEFPATREGEINYNQDYSELTVGISPIPIPGTGGKNYNDTLVIAFLLKDKAGNVSDTAWTEAIVVER